MVRRKTNSESTNEADLEKRRVASAVRLRQLERDQAGNAGDAIGVDNDIFQSSDESDEEGRVGTKRKSAAVKTGRAKSNAVKIRAVLEPRGVRRPKKTVEMIVMSDPMVGDTFLSIEAPPAVRPPLKLCSVCSFMGEYKCVRCRAIFCSIPCLAIHRDTRCIRFGYM